MAIAGKAAPSFIAQIVGNELVLDRQTLRQGVVHDIDTAVHRLLAGETIFLSARSDVVTAVQRTLQMALGGANNDSATN